MANTISHYTFYLVGDRGVGKTSYLQRLTTGHFMQQNQNIEECFTYDASFNTNYGRKNVSFVELNECDNFDCDGVIFMFDKTKMNTLNNIEKIMEEHSQYIDNFVLCGNKSDLKNQCLSSDSDFKNYPNIPKKKNYYDISVRSLNNFEKPILSLLQQIQTNNNINGNNLIFIPNHINAADFLV